MDGSLPSEGRLEVFHSGEWGTVCSNSFTIVEAHVACHHLGYSGAVAYHNDTRFGQGNGKSLYSLEMDRGTWKLSCNLNKSTLQMKFNFERTRSRTVHTFRKWHQLSIGTSLIGSL